jgi:hypothetical protein
VLPLLLAAPECSSRLACTARPSLDPGSTRLELGPLLARSRLAAGLPGSTPPHLLCPKLVAEARRLCSACPRWPAPRGRPTAQLTARHSRLGAQSQPQQSQPAWLATWPQFPPWPYLP